MAEKLKSESELFTLSLCTNCDNAPIGEQCVAAAKTTNLPSSVLLVGILTTYDTKSYGSGFPEKLQKIVGLSADKTKTIIMTRGYAHNIWTDWFDDIL